MRPPASETTRVDVFRRWEDLEPLVPEWDALAQEAGESNVFYEPFLLLPALRHLPGGASVRTLFIRASGGRLLGVVPVQRRWCSLSVPAPHSTNWQHPYCFLGTPLVRAGHEDPVVEGLARWAGRLPGGVLRLDALTEGGPFDSALQRASGAAVRAIASHERAFVRPTGSAEEYFATTIPRKKRKELRRQRNRLAEVGRLDVCVLDAAAGVDRFLELEHRGWKGGEGTSIASSPRDRSFLHDAARPDRLDVFALVLDGAPIAIALTFLGGGGAFTFKIAYDEAYGRYSPGVQLEVDLLEHLIADLGVRWADSCAAPNHPMIDALWGERRRIRSVCLTTRSALGVALGRSTGRLESAARSQAATWSPETRRRLRWFQKALVG